MRSKFLRCAESHLLAQHARQISTACRTRALGQPTHCEFARGVRAEVRVALLSRRGRRADDPPTTALCNHLLACMLVCEDGAVQVGANVVVDRAEVAVYPIVTVSA